MKSNLFLFNKGVESFNLCNPKTGVCIRGKRYEIENNPFSRVCISTGMLNQAGDCGCTVIELKNRKVKVLRECSLAEAIDIKKGIDQADKLDVPEMNEVKIKVNPKPTENFERTVYWVKNGEEFSKLYFMTVMERLVSDWEPLPIACELGMKVAMGWSEEKLLSHLFKDQNT